MKLTPKKISGMVHYEDEPKASKKSKQSNKLPSDEYKPLFPPMRFQVREYSTYKDPNKKVKVFLEVSVKRLGEDDDEAPVCVFISMYQESEKYTGYLKGKCTYFPLEEIATVIEYLQDTLDTADELNLF